MVKKLLLFPIALLVGLFLGSVTKEAYAQIMQLSDGTYGHKIVIYNLDGTAVSSFGGGTPGGADTQVQYNDAGAFNGESAFAWNETSNSLTLGTTAELEVFNTADIVTNYEKVSLDWSSDIAFLRTLNAGSGTARDLAIRAAGTNLYLQTNGGSGSASIQLSSSGSISIGGSGISTNNVGRWYLSTRQAVTIDGATNFTPLSSYVVLACTGAETINTIDGSVGLELVIEHTDTECTIADDDDATAANAIDLTGTATDDVGAVNKMITLRHNGTYWMQVSESDN